MGYQIYLVVSFFIRIFESVKHNFNLKTMRLIVHVTDAKKEKIEVESKEKPGTYYKKEILKNTFSFDDVESGDVDRIINQVESDGLGKVTKHYLSGQKIVGRTKKKKK